MFKYAYRYTGFGVHFERENILGHTWFTASKIQNSGRTTGSVQSFSDEIYRRSKSVSLSRGVAGKKNSTVWKNVKFKL